MAMGRSNHSILFRWSRPETWRLLELLIRCYGDIDRNLGGSSGRAGGINRISTGYIIVENRNRYQENQRALLSLTKTRMKKTTD